MVKLDKLVLGARNASNATIGKIRTATKIGTKAVCDPFARRIHSFSEESSSPRNVGTLSSPNKERQKTLEELQGENQWLRERVIDLEMELEQQQRDFEAQKDLGSFGGLSMLRASNVTLGKKLGEGSFGAVYQGQWRGVKCAVKFLNQSVVEEMCRECSIMDNIDHPNIVRLYGLVVPDHGHDKSLPESWQKGLEPPCLLMEYMGYNFQKKKCSTFIDYLEAARASAGENLREQPEFWIGICGMLQDAAKGMAYLHSHGVMHRDMKGLNLLLDARGILKIADFGLAKLYATGTIERVAVTASWKTGPLKLPSIKAGLTTAAGTYTHMAPEVMTSGTYDTTADIFSFGIIISEAVAAAEGEEIVETSRTPEFGLDPVKLRTLAPPGIHIIDQLVSLAVQCSDLDSSKRPNANHIIGRLQSIQLEHQSTQLKSTTTAEHISKKVFEAADLDADGFLSYDEINFLAQVTSEDSHDLTKEDYNNICDAVGADSSAGLACEHVVKLYTELNLGDPVVDWQTLTAVGSPKQAPQTSS